MNNDRTKSGTSGNTSEPALPTEVENVELVDIEPVKPDAAIEQAKADLDAGLVDTDMRVTPGLDAALRDTLVPGPGGNPPGRKRGQED